MASISESKDAQSWVAHQLTILYQLALYAVPYRAVFFTTLTQDGSREKLDERLLKALGGLDTIVARMGPFLIDGGYGRIYDTDAPPVIPSAAPSIEPSGDEKEYEVI